MPKFIVQFSGQESVAELKVGTNSIGRQSSCTMPLKDSTLSRLHCEVILAGTVATLVDKGSRNGTLLNGKKIEAEVLKPGDKVQIGATTLWYEKKNVASEAPKSAPAAPAAAAAAAPAPSTRRTVGQPDTGVRKAQADTGVRKAQAESGSRKAQGAPARPSALAESAQPQLKDYAYHGKGGGNAGKIVAAVLGVAVLVSLGVLGKNFLSRPVVVVDDSENLARNPHFELATSGKPDSWAMRPSMSGEKSSCVASVDSSHGRNGRSCLLLEKQGGAADLVAECALQEDLPIAKGSAVSVSAWTQFDTFAGQAALKIDWLRSSKGAAIAEEFSDTLARTQTWTEMKAVFSPPAGAGAYRIALAIVGRSGRIYFDDVTVKTQSGAPAAPEKKIGAHKVSTVRSGIAQIELRGGRRTLTNVALRLESEKEGSTPQAYSVDVTAKPEAEGLVFEGKMFSPLDFRDIVFEERIGQNEGLTNVAYQFRGDALKQVDRVTIALTLPRVDGPPRGIPESGDPTSRITLSAEDGDFAIEYAEPARVKYRTVDGRLRIFQTWTVDPQAEDPAFIFRIREAGGLGPLDPQAALSELKAQRKYGEALALARDQVKKIREVPVREKMEGEIKNLEDLERRDWAEAQAIAFQGRISRRAELVAKALATLASFGKEWNGEGTEAKADALRREIEKELASTPAGETERPRRLFERAKRFMETGKRALAQTLLQTLVAKFPSSDVAPEAQTLLKTLSE
jgi:hypothetical protein